MNIRENITRDVFIVQTVLYIILNQHTFYPSIYNVRRKTFRIILPYKYNIYVQIIVNLYFLNRIIYYIFVVCVVFIPNRIKKQKYVPSFKRNMMYFFLFLKVVLTTSLISFHVNIKDILFDVFMILPYQQLKYEQ